MSYCRKTVAFFRRRQKIITLIVVSVFLYSLIQSSGETGTSAKVRLEDDGLYKTGQKYRRWLHLNPNIDAGLDGYAPRNADSPLNLGSDQLSLSTLLLNDTNSLTAPKSSQIEYCEQKYQTEAVADFNTFEIIKHVLAGNGQLLNKTTHPKHDSAKLRVFFLPMTHVDPGWLKTFGNYCSDADAILNNMHQFLKEHPKMRFMWCEIAFFEHWWNEVNETVKSDIRNMISKGQLEIASGAWVMSDEANPYFASSVDNIIEGQQFVLNELGTKPKVIWSNDPFGYGLAIPYLFTKTGIRRAVINRIHHGIKKYLQSKRAVPFLWRQYFDSNHTSDILTQVLPYTHYDILNSCGPDQAVCCQFDFKRMNHFSCPGTRPVPITDTNKKEKAALLKHQLFEMSEMYESNVLLVMWGDDFRYDKLEEWYQQYDNLTPLFDQLNSEGDIEVRFGTFDDYFNALEEFYELKKASPATLSGDFFPYQCAMGDRWTGYYTTRPFFKKLERQLHARIYAADLMTLNAESVIPDDDKLEAHKKLTDARRSLALFQHHDAITGTSRKHVMKDYATLMHNSFVEVGGVMQKTANVLFNSTFQMNENARTYDEILSHTLINLNSGDKILVNVWNSLTYEQQTIIMLRISTINVIVKQQDHRVVAQIEPYFDVNKAQYTEDFQLLFSAKLRPLSNNLYTLEYSESPSAELVQIYSVLPPSQSEFKQTFPSVFVAKAISAEKFLIKTARLKTKHNLSTGFLEAFENADTSIMLKQDFIAHERDSGGAYTMHFTGTENQLALNDLSRHIFKGPVRHNAVVHSKILHQWITATTLDDADDDFLHMDMRVDIRHLCGLQLVTTFDTSLDSETTQMFTDSNGMQLVKREFHRSLDRASNYYPMPTVFMLQDKNVRLSIVSNLEHGARVHGSAGVEIMLDRLMCRDDGKGLGAKKDSIPDDILPVMIGFTIVLENMENASMPLHYAYNTVAAHRALQKRLYLPVVMLSKGAFLSTEQISLSLPCDVQIVCSRPLPQNLNRRLLVLHRLGTDCSSATKIHCSTLSLNNALKEYLKSIKVVKVQRTNLSGTNNEAPKVSIDDLQLRIQPMDFLALILYIE